MTMGGTMKIYLPDGTVTEMKKGKVQIADLLGELRINPLEVLVAKNGRIVTEDVIVGDEDEVKIIGVKSGG
jgi:sulfur carrier protein ThiS